MIERYRRARSLLMPFRGNGLRSVPDLDATQCDTPEFSI
jgi:hypothetical protein